ncbi:TnsA-like heteromeric transposase endonuclease subunit [Tsukamurella sp. PLM1]|uniref:TnsA-like heteromeric transposase endonuclease subunit n=1 Tax=Tsukamurella sp. PLM1 TaxID=2929795 RepID=UPI0020BFF8D0|nr:TnsA-like heteromeric transposase endonuclease subunit [Tsukamurella sp. PLM1]
MTELATAAPWRTFRSYLGQTYYSGSYWSATTQSLVIYESRLELANLILADFNTSVRNIAAQPFRLTTMIDGKTRNHVPDYLLDTETGPVVVDVKPAEFVGKVKVAATLEWTRELIEERGWRYEIASEPPATRMMNVRFLAGFRHNRYVDGDLVLQIREVASVGMRVADVLSQFPGQRDFVRAALFHMMWTQQISVDLDSRLTEHHLIREIQ